MIAACCKLGGTGGHEAGRVLLRRLYQMTEAAPMPPIRIAPGGKPDFESGEYHFSISHTDHYAFCVLARCPVGIDAEELNRAIRPRTVSRILSPSELEQYRRANDPARAFLTFWVLKEAEAKRTGTGLRGFPNHTNFTLDDPRVHQWSSCLVAISAEEDEEGVTFYAL